MLNKLEQLRKNRKSDQSGFTIIEVMIVLAIAGLILLIVLLAVPALQRNSRNTQIKNDAANIVGAISTFTSDNDGKVPATITASDGVVTLTKLTATATAEIQKGTTINSPVTAEPAAVEPGTLTLRFGATCKNSATTRSVSVYYSIETSSGPQVKCTNS